MQSVHENTLAQKVLRNEWECVDAVWSNDARCNGHLLNPFRPSREDNPPEWDDKMKFWKRMIDESCGVILAAKRATTTRIPPEYTSSSGSGAASSVEAAEEERRALGNLSPFCFTFDELLKRFQRKGRPPQCLSVVIEAMLAEKSLVPASELAPAQGPLFDWKRAAASLSSTLMSPLKQWWFGGSSSHAAAGAPEMLVAINPLNAACDAYLAHHYRQALNPLTDHIVTMHRFREICREQFGLGGSDAALLLRALEKRQKVCTLPASESGDQILKFAATSAEKAAVKEIDRKIGSIFAAQGLIARNLRHLEEKADSLKAKVLELAEAKRKAQALRYLQLRRQVEAKIEQFHNASHNLEHIVLEIQNLQMQKEILDSYVAGVDVLKTVKKSFGLSIEKVESVMDDVNEVLSEQAEIDAALTADIAEQPIDMDEIEAELAALSLQPSSTPSTPSRTDTAPSQATDDTAAASLARLPGVPTTPLRPATSATKAPAREELAM